MFLCHTGMSSWEKCQFQCLKIALDVPMPLLKEQLVEVPKFEQFADIPEDSGGDRFRGFLPGQSSSVLCQAEHRKSRG